MWNSARFWRVIAVALGVTCVFLYFDAQDWRAQWRSCVGDKAEVDSDLQGCKTKLGLAESYLDDCEAERRKAR